MTLYKLNHFQSYAQKYIIHVAVILVFLGGTVGQGICSAEANLAQLNQVTTAMAKRMNGSSGGGSNESFITFFDNLVRIAQGTLITKNHVTSGGLDAEVNFYTNYLYSIGQALDILAASDCLAIQQRIKTAQHRQPSYQLHVLGRTIASVYDVVQRIRTPNSRLRFATYDEFRQKIMTIISQERAERERTEQQRVPQQRNIPSAAAKPTKAPVVTTPAVQTQPPSSDEAARRAAARAAFAARNQDPYKQMEEYIQKSRIVNMYGGAEREQIATAMRTALTKQIQDNGGRWMGGEALKVAEHFYWNLSKSIIIESSIESSNYLNENKIILGILFRTRITSTWDNFVTFYTPHIREIMGEERKEIMREQLPFYLAFLIDDERQAFMDFCAQYIDELGGEDIFIMERFLSIYQAFPNDGERQAFVDFCNPYTNGLRGNKKAHSMKNLLPIYQAFPNDGERQAFVDFCNPYTNGLRGNEKAPSMKNLLPIYQAFPVNDKRRQAFIDFCNPYTDGLGGYGKVKIINDLFPIYQAFPNDGERQAFVDFCNPYTNGLRGDGKAQSMKNLLPIYQAFSNDGERQAFVDFCASYTDRLRGTEGMRLRGDTKEHLMKQLLPIYQAFPDHRERQAFMDFSARYTAEVPECRKVEAIRNSLPIYQAFSNDGERQAFIDFCNPYTPHIRYSIEKLKLMNSLLFIYKDPVERQSFNAFMQPHQDRVRNKENLLIRYLSRAYLRDMRVDSALKAEPLNTRRVQPMYETDLDDQLPIFFAQDPFIQQARNVAGMVANAHEFDAIYVQDQAILWGLAKAPTESAVTRKIRNNREAPYNHRSNVEVDDFITYLETEIARDGIRIDGVTIPGERVVYIIKMLLGLAPKDANTTGGFPPYLSSSMYYAKSDAPRGDEMLGRTWAFIKRMATEKNDPDLKKAVVLALLETVELSGERIDTHCQTRISGELFKMLSWHLPDSTLRSLISANDSPAVVSDADMPARINAAPIRARDLFHIIKREDSGETRRLIERCIQEGRDPELWERYEAYYDDLYRRTKVTDGTPYNERLHIQSPDGRMYKRDEHILTRDDHGNLVSLYDQNGALRAQPIIVYYQAEFQVFEHAFTQLMKHEFEDQRGLKY